MTAREQIAEAKRPLGGPIAVSDAFEHRLAFKRLVDRGWQFTDGGPESVMVLKPDGGGWHQVVTGGYEGGAIYSECDCKAWYFRSACTHMDAADACGGVAAIKGFINE